MFYLITLTVQIRMHSLWVELMETVQHGVLDYLRISFLIAGHTKFDVDHLFSVTAKSYNSTDVFNTQELDQIFVQSESITAVLEDGRLIQKRKLL